jgi:uncharacterized protein
MPGIIIRIDTERDKYMPLNLDDNQASYQIRGFTPGALKINNDIYTHSVIVAADTLISDWEPQTITELTAAHLEAIIAMKPAILLIGTGTTLTFPEISVYGDLINHGIGVEIMNTSAACRTYNALTAENRQVVAAIFVD